MRQPGVVERPALLGDPHRPRAEVGRPAAAATSCSPSATVTPTAQPREPGQVDRGARERHGGVEGQRPRVQGCRGSEHREPVAAGGVGDELALAQRATGREHRDDVAQHVVRHREQQQVARPGDVRRLPQRYAGEQRGGPAPGRVRLGGRRDDLVPGPGRAAASTAPTRPAPTTPTRNRAGRVGLLISRTSRFGPADIRGVAAGAGTRRCVSGGSFVNLRSRTRRGNGPEV